MKEVDIHIDIGSMSGTHKGYALEDEGYLLNVGWFVDGSGVFIKEGDAIVAISPNCVDKLIERLRYAKERARATLEGNE